MVVLASHAIGAEITKQDTARALRAIDDQCGDTWCEGDYSFQFKKLLCFQDSTSCKLYFNMSYENQEKGNEVTDPKTGAVYQIASEAYSYQVACRINNIRELSDLLTGEGPHKRLNRRVYSSLTDCISRLEEKLNKHTFPKGG